MAKLSPEEADKPPRDCTPPRLEDCLSPSHEASLAAVEDLFFGFSSSSELPPAIETLPFEKVWPDEELPLSMAP